MQRRRLAVLASVLLTLSLLTSAGASSPERRVRALFFGDSLVAGTGTLPQRPIQVLAAAEQLGWRAIVDARGGTGYTTGGRRGQPYLHRLQHDGYLRTAYDVIVLEGGTNDARHGSLADLHDSALRTIDYVRSRQPRAQLILVGAFAPHGVPVGPYRQVDEVLAGVASERQLQYISQLPYSTVTDKGFLSADAYHPSTAGYTRMGRDLATAIQRS